MPQSESVSVDTGPEGYPGYRLDAKGGEEHEGGRLELLEQLFDPGSRRRRDLVKPDWRYLEVGAGSYHTPVGASAPG